MTSCTTHHCINDLISVWLSQYVIMYYLSFIKLIHIPEFIVSQLSHGATWPNAASSEQRSWSTELCRNYQVGLELGSRNVTGYRS